MSCGNVMSVFVCASQSSRCALSVSAAFTWLCRRYFWHWENRSALIAPLHRPSTHPSSPPAQPWRTLAFWSRSQAPPPALNKIPSCLRQLCYSKQQPYPVRLRSVCSYPHSSYKACEALKFSLSSGPHFVSLHSLPVQSSSARVVVSHRYHKHTVKVALSQRTLISSCIKKTKKKPHACWVDGLTVSLSSVVKLFAVTRKAMTDRTEQMQNWRDLTSEPLREEREGLWDKRRSSAGLESNYPTERRRGEQGSNRSAKKVKNYWKKKRGTGQWQKNSSIDLLTLQTSTSNLHHHGHRHWPQPCVRLPAGQSDTCCHINILCPTKSVS